VASRCQPCAARPSATCGFDLRSTSCSDPAGATTPDEEEIVRVLLVEDDDRVAAALTDLLRRHGVVGRAATGREALSEQDVDLVLLDLGLPGMAGAAVCRPSAAPPRCRSSR
jgi:response regulator RpfG family c-di-GMP phosphodiesterase